MRTMIYNAVLKPAILIIVLFSFSPASAQHPSIMLTKKLIPEVIKGIGQYPLLKKSFVELKKLADEGVSKPVNVPVPKDGGGGYTHEQHKKNYQYILAAATAWQVTKEKKYAEFVKTILLNYASQYQKWPLHPKSRSSNPAGKIFWQNLNDCVWQVYVIQGYDLVYDYLSLNERNNIEQNLFVPVVKFLSEDNYETFNRIHNHGTWDVAAVGITGYVLHNKDWVERSLHGSKKNDSTGFLAQVRQLFSPDGYYTEGPYYQRYALLPFLLFAKTIQQYQPGLKIFDYNNSVLKKAIQTSLQTTYTNGAFFPVNDALKEKTYESEELVYGVDISYADISPETDLLDIANHQGKVIVSDDGLQVANDVAAGKTKPFVYKTLWLGDGTNGDEGGLGILRQGGNDDQQCLVLKAASQGMGHGHFDRLNFLYYDNGNEIFSDYGSARFLNIETKSGGDYLPENKTWAKQTVAHNTLVVDQVSHYKADVNSAQLIHPELIYFKDEKNLKIVSAKETNAYKDVSLTRTLVLTNFAGLEKPLIIDVFKVRSEKEHQYDLPYWYQGHITYTPFKTRINTKKLEPLGKDYGYQHIWLNGTGNSESESTSVTFLNHHRFYTTTFLVTATEIEFVTTGANDPDLNLRNEKGFILSTKAKDHVFISLIESHGYTDPVAETTRNFKGKVQSLKLITDNDETTSFNFTIENKTYIVTISYNNQSSFITIK